MYIDLRLYIYMYIHRHRYRYRRGAQSCQTLLIKEHTLNQNRNPACTGDVERQLSIDLRRRLLEMLSKTYDRVS